MPSRIRIGPDGGPYVIVEENNGDLDITTPDNTIDLQNSGLINAALSGVLDAQNNDISNVGALTADSVNTDNLNIGGSDFVSTGDFMPYYTFGGADTLETTTNSTYTDVLTSEAEPRLIWDSLFPSEVTTAIVVNVGIDAKSDPTDFRIFNLTDSETLIEQTGVSGLSDTISIGPVNYRPTTTSDNVVLTPQLRNSDGTSEVAAFDLTYSIGISL